MFDAELSALPQATASNDEEANSTKHILSFAVPSSVAAQIDETSPKLIVALNEVKDETAAVLDAETRVLASAIFSKLISKQSHKKETITIR